MTQPDEGLIHAWLDGALPPDEAARVEELVASDPAWSEAAAEARGLIAASARILSALDHVPAGVTPNRRQATTVHRTPWWTRVAAAMVIVAGGSVLVMQRSGSRTLPAPATDIVAQQPRTAGRASAEDAAKSAVGNAPEVRNAPAQNAPAQKVPAQQAPAPDAAAPDRGVTDFAVRARAADAVKAAVPPPPFAMNTGGVAGVAPSAMQSVVAKASSEVSAGAAMPTAAPMLLAERTANAKAATTLRTANVNDSSAQGQRREVSLTGVVTTGIAAKEAPKVGLCYRVVDRNNVGGVVMRVMKVDGDTLRLEAGAPKTALYAWLVRQDERLIGAMSAEASYRGAVSVTGAPAPCSAP